MAIKSVACAIATLAALALLASGCSSGSGSTVPAPSPTLTETPSPIPTASPTPTVSPTPSPSPTPTPAPLSSDDINLIFVTSDDLAYNAIGDLNPTTANLAPQGLQRALQTASYLQTAVLGGSNVSWIYVLEPVTHQQLNLPDMVPAETIQQFALLNQFPETVGTGNSYPLNASYATPGPSGIATPSVCANCQGLDFQDQNGDNESLVSGIISGGKPGFYVFVAPWETISSLMGNVNTLKGYHLALPGSFAGPNVIYTFSISSSGTAVLSTFNSAISPPASYPTLSPTPALTPCAEQTPFTIQVTIGQSGAVKPTGINTNETVYLIRHAEAHEPSGFDDGNYICQGQWRALDLPNVLPGVFSSNNAPVPNQIWSVDISQVIEGSTNTINNTDIYSYVRPALTIEPYAISSGLPFNLVSSSIWSACSETQPGNLCPSADFFFKGGQFSGATLMVAWEHGHIPPMVNHLLGDYFPSGIPPADVAPAWPGGDFDTIWQVSLDSHGNLTVNNNLCEGINTNLLPLTCPQF